MKSTIDILMDEVDKTVKLIDDLLDNSKIVKTNYEYSPGVVFIAPDYTWAELNEKGLILKDKALKSCKGLFEYLDFLFEDKPREITDRYHDVKEALFYWIERDKGGWDFGLPSSINAVKAQLREKTTELKKLLSWLSESSTKEIILIPDTNTLIRNKEINTYGEKLGIENNKYTVIFLPTVLSELDKLKVTHRDEEFRKKIESIIKMIKGYRKQGNIHEGVTIFRSITVKMKAVEPNMQKTLKWLDPENNDDRIIASCLEIQKEYLGAKVILVTSDINHQNKAELALLPFAEVD